MNLDELGTDERSLLLEVRQSLVNIRTCNFKKNTDPFSYAF